MPGTTTLYAPYGVPNVPITSNWLANVVVAAVFTSISSLVLALRLLTTTLRHRPLGADDWTMYLAYLSSLAFTTASAISLRWGVGLPSTAAPPGWSINALKATYAVEIFYYFSIFLVKLSILFLYLRIADGLGNRFYKGTLATMAVLVVHFITTIVVAGVQCVPMSRFWDYAPLIQQGPGRCINITAFFYSTNVFTILTDIVILVLPLRTFAELKRPRAQKIALIGAFAVGGVSTLASCVRLYSVRRFMNGGSTAAGEGRGLEDAAPINTWSFVEIYLGILCASVPAIKPLFFPPNRTKTPLSSFSNSIHRLRDFSVASEPRSGDWSAAHPSAAPPKMRPRPNRADDIDGEFEEISLNDFLRAGPQQAFGDGQGPQSAVLTSSQGSLRRYSQETDSSLDSTILGKAATGPKEAV